MSWPSEMTVTFYGGTLDGRTKTQPFSGLGIICPMHDGIEIWEELYDWISIDKDAKTAEARFVGERNRRSSPVAVEDGE